MPKLLQCTTRSAKWRAIVRQGSKATYLHGLFIWLHTPGEGIIFVDSDPADDVRLFELNKCLKARYETVLKTGAKDIVTRMALTLLWTSSFSMPAIVSVVAQHDQVSVNS